MEAAYEEDLKMLFATTWKKQNGSQNAWRKYLHSCASTKMMLKISEAMSALIGETNKIIDEFESGPVRDSALIICAQKVEHYEIAAYGSLRNTGRCIGPGAGWRCA
jgi:ferritin-like metal-binding protein YciE